MQFFKIFISSLISGFGKPFLLDPISYRFFGCLPILIKDLIVSRMIVNWIERMVEASHSRWLLTADETVVVVAVVVVGVD